MEAHLFSAAVYGGTGAGRCVTEDSPRQPLWKGFTRSDGIAITALVLSLLAIGGDLLGSFAPAFVDFRRESALEVVDVFPFDGEHGSVDVKLRNTGEKVAVLTRVFFNVERVWRFETPRCLPEFDFPRSLEGVNGLWGGAGERVERIADGDIAPNEAYHAEYKFWTSMDWNESRVLQVSFDYLYDEDDRPLHAGPVVILLGRIPHEGHYIDSHCLDGDRIRDANDRNAAFAQEVHNLENEKSAEVTHLVREILKARQAEATAG